MTPTVLNTKHLEAVLSAWPGALRAERTAAELRATAAEAARELAVGRTDVINGLFTEMASPPPRLQWTPEDDDLETPRLRFLNGYWRTRSPLGEPPSSALIDPLDLVPLLGYLMLLEPLDGGADFRYRVYGSRIVEYSRVEMTGKCVWDVPAPLVAAYFVATYRAVVERRQSLFAHHRTHHHIQVAQWDRLILPFVDEHGDVNRLLVGNVPSIRPAGPRRPGPVAGRPDRSDPGDT